MFGIYWKDQIGTEVLSAAEILICIHSPRGNAFEFLQSNNTVLSEMDIEYSKDEWDFIQK